RVRQPVLPNLTQRLADVARVTDIKGDTKTTLVRRDGVWRVEEKYDYPADAVRFGGGEIRRAEDRQTRSLFAARRRGSRQEGHRFGARHVERFHRQADGRDDFRQAPLRYFRRRQ